MQTSTKKQMLSVHHMMNQLSYHLSCCHAGTFLIATQDNRSCRLALSAGRVTHCTLGRQHGNAALNIIPTLTEGYCSFVKNLNYPFKERSKIEDKQAVEIVMATLNDQLMNTSDTNTQQKHPSGLTGRQMETLFGQFHFE